MTKKSAGILLYKMNDGKLDVFLVHPGGPFWQNKDDGSWSIPKGEFNPDEEPLAAAKREFYEETGAKIEADFIELSPVKLKSGKEIFAFAALGNIDAAKIKSNEFEMEWPPRSGKHIRFAEVDRGEWFSCEIATIKINSAQADFILQLQKILNI